MMIWLEDIPEVKQKLKNAWVNLWYNQSKSAGSMVACHQGTRIDAAVSKSASLKKQVARPLSGRQLLQPVTFLICFLS